MTPELWARVRSAFHEVAELSPDARAHRLALLAREAPEVHAEVTSLLAARAKAPDFLASGPLQSLPADPAATWVGKQLGPYHIEKLLGQGGMGVAYLARDQRLGRLVTLKMVAPGVRDDPTRRARLEREARALALLSHPGVAHVYALERLDDHAFIVSEYVPGRTLRDLLADGPLAAGRALDIFRQLARALSAAHSLGIVHRDLKPENVIVRDDGIAKVLDFGLALVHGHGDDPRGSSPRLTETGSVVGTPAYMAPEQLAGHAVDARADVYALGVVAYELMTGQHPFAEATRPASTAFDQSAEGRALRPVVERCLEAMPQRRFVSARELANALDAIDAPTADAPPGAATATSNATARRSAGWRTSGLWWWQFHQAMVSTLYVSSVALLWSVQSALGGWGRLAFLGGVALASIGVSYRCHLWFVSVFHSAGLGAARRSAARWLCTVDVGLAAAVAGAALLVAREHEVVASALTAVGVLTAVAAWRIEPMTAAAAFDRP